MSFAAAEWVASVESPLSRWIGSTGTIAMSRYPRAGGLVDWTWVRSIDDVLVILQSVPISTEVLIFSRLAADRFVEVRSGDELRSIVGSICRSSTRAQTEILVFAVNHSKQYHSDWSWDDIECWDPYFDRSLSLLSCSDYLLVGPKPNYISTDPELVLSVSTGPNQPR